MPRTKGATAKQPKYRKHKASGRACVELSGKTYYLGEYDSPKSYELYHRLVAEWRVRQCQIAPTTSKDTVTIVEVLAAYWIHCQQFYRESPNSLEMVRRSLRFINALYGRTLAQEFGPKAFKTIRDHIIETKRTRTGERLSRSTVNSFMYYIAEAFKWAAEEEIIHGSVFHSIACVEPLTKQSRSLAREPRKVGPVPQEDLDATLPLMPQQIRDICDLVLLSGARSGEICILRACDLDMRDPKCWRYSPSKHKGQHLGNERTVYFGPPAQDILARYLTPSMSDFLFKPLDIAAPFTPDAPKKWRMGEQRPKKHVPLGDGASRPRRRGRRWPHIRQGNLYDWIKRACVRADELAHKAHPEIAADVKIVQPWHPHQLRHTAATRYRERYGAEAARTLLGHKHLDTTEIYAERDEKLIMKLVAGDAG